MSNPERKSTKTVQTGALLARRRLRLNRTSRKRERNNLSQIFNKEPIRDIGRVKAGEQMVSFFSKNC